MRSGFVWKWGKHDIHSLCVVYCLICLRARHLSLRFPARKERSVVRGNFICCACVCGFCMTGLLLGGMSGKCGTIDNLHVGAVTDGLRVGSRLVSR